MLNPSAATMATLVGLVVFAFILYRQVQVRVVTTRLTLPAVLTLAGLASLGGMNQKALAPQDIAILVVLLGIDAIGLGAARAYTVRLWHEGTRWVRQGTWATVGLWLIGTGIHMGVDNALGFGTASVLLYLGVTYGAQRLVVQRRIRQLAIRSQGDADTAPAARWTWQ